MQNPKTLSKKNVDSTEDKPSLASLAVTGISWKTIATVVQLGLSFVIGIVLARLLTPEDFGIVGYASIFIGFSNRLAEAGIAPALVQLQNLNKKLVSGGFLISISVGVVTWLILWLIAPIITQGDRFIALRILSIIFLINSPAMISNALLQRELNFFRLFLADTLPYLFGYGVISMVLALNHFGVWSLVWGTVAQSIIRSLLLFFLSPYSISFDIGKEELRSMLRFGSGMTLARLANFGAGNLDYFVVGQNLGDQALGLYQRSFQIITIPITRIAGVLTSVLFPTFSRIQSDHQKMKFAFLSSVSLTSLISTPLLAFLALSSTELIITLYGNQWQGASFSLSVLSLNAIFTSIYTLGDALARANGLVYHQFRRHFLYAVLVLVFALIGSAYSINAVAVGVTLATLIMYLLMAQLSLRILGATWTEFIYSQLPGWRVAILVAFSILITNELGQLWATSTTILLIIKVIAALLALTLTVLFFPINWLGEIPKILIKLIETKQVPPQIIKLINMRFRKGGHIIG